MSTLLPIEILLADDNIHQQELYTLHVYKCIVFFLLFYQFMCFSNIKEVSNNSITKQYNTLMRGSMTQREACLPCHH